MTGWELIPGDDWSEPEERLTIRGEVIKEAVRLGATPEQLAAFEANTDDHDFREEFSVSQSFPDPEDATNEEFALSAALSIVRQSAACALERRLENLPAQQSRMADAREERKETADGKARGIADLWKRMLSGAQEATEERVTGQAVRQRLLDNLTERARALGSADAEVPSLSVIYRARPK